MAFDTLSYARRLKASGFSDEQAETLADATRELVVQDFATKGDIATLKMRSWQNGGGTGLKMRSPPDPMPSAGP